MTLSAEKAPGAHERADGQIEGAFARAAVLDAIGQETEQLRRDFDRTRGRLAIDTAPLARGPVIREQRVQAVGFLKRCVDRLVHGRPIGAIEDDGKRRPHGIRASFQLAAVRLPAPAGPLRTGRETNGSGLLLRHLVLPKGFVVEHRFLDGHAAHIDLFQVRRPESRGLGQKHHIVGVLERLIAGL